MNGNFHLMILTLSHLARLAGGPNFLDPLPSEWGWEGERESRDNRFLVMSLKPLRNLSDGSI